MGSMTAAVLTAPRQFELLRVPIPEIEPDEVLIRVLRTGICGTDLHIWNGHYAADRLPLVPGHEFVGLVAVRGASVRHLTEGQRVVVDINLGCGTCLWCRRNEVLNCPDVQQLGISRDGAFAEYVAVPGRQAIAVPDGVPDAVAALTEPLACVVRAAGKAGAGLGQSVVVLGAGPIGNLHVQLMRLMGAAPIIAADLTMDRCQMALEAGADAAISDMATLRPQVLALTQGRGADLVIESVGSPRLYDVAFQLIRKGGHVAFFGLTGPGEAISIDILRTILQENSLKGSVAGMGDDMHQALTLLAHGRIATKALTGASFPLAKIAEAFETAADRPRDLKTQIIVGSP